MYSMKAGFSRLDVTPPLGIEVAGYYESRIADGVLDPLTVSAVAISDGENRSVLLSLDALGLDQKNCTAIRKMIAGRTGLSEEAVLITCTHTHTGPILNDKRNTPDPIHNEWLFRKMADAAVLALADLKPADIYGGRSIAPGISFVRRFRMKDGSVRTNPGVGNPDIAEPLGTPDETVQLVRFKRTDAPDILLVNFQVHPDVIGGCAYSADYPGFVRQTVEQALGSVRCIYFNGAQGDTNHINVHPIAGADSMTKDFDGVKRGYEHSRHMGRCIAGAALQIYTELRPYPAGPVRFGQIEVTIPSSRVPADQVRNAEKIIALHETGRDSELGYRDMELTTVVAEAYRMKSLEQGPDAFSLRISAIRFGDIAFSGIPGEPFTDIGRQIKQGSPFPMTCVCCCANGYEGYYPTRSAYDDGGYEARSSSFKPGVAEQMIDSSLQLLHQIH
ncbi:MAG: hypothetical protein VB070_07785 [Clostridiaceae bacterium]|nr:hypothetical protein [Clostridiaceae bacterium]